ncbi:ketopantoate reductase family protein [Bacillus sp. PS06]|uniref:ketopantoate reductase family protein n=1 Tax=Bacillus sp. PS06 TaxID=2764176 RepID=UPI001784A546|nr:ketopantoate reductase family protein [Bacillus sp. PS06]MBD8067382.1 ketopantoate reductase family protein [Bacillus sp. PS06]
MRVLVVGAGAVGGYFGARLHEKGEDVTFLVREKRREQLNQNGLKVESVNGNVTIHPKMIVASDEAQAFDVILLSTKAYHLDNVLNDIDPFVGETTMILPVLNGIAHLEIIQQRYGIDRVLGGLSFIESTLDKEGTVLQTSPSHDILFGELNGQTTERITKLNEVFSGTKAHFRKRSNILQDMWHKYIFITTLSGITSLTRSPVGPIRQTKLGQELIVRYGKEILSIVEQIKAPVGENAEEFLFGRMDFMTDEMKSSMQRDMEKGLHVEADHLQGYLYEKAVKEGIDVPVLQTIYTNLKIYESQI